MAHLTLAGLSDDGKRLLLVSDKGVEFTLDADTLTIFWCRDRATLLGTQADRFFITPHYGHAGTPGSVLTRLGENGRDHLEHLSELLHDAWRQHTKGASTAALD